MTVSYEKHGYCDWILSAKNLYATCSSCILALVPSFSTFLLVIPSHDGLLVVKKNWHMLVEQLLEAVDCFQMTCYALNLFDSAKTKRSYDDKR